MKDFLSTFLKGKLEGIGWGSFLATILTEKSAIIESFSSGSDAGMPALLISGASLVGAIWGKLRRNSTEYQSK